MPELTAAERNARATRLRWTIAAVLVVAVAAALFFAWRTRDSVASLQAAKMSRSGDKTQLVVDTSSLSIARQLSSEAVLPDEKPLSADALKLSDHEIDQAFSTALRDSLSPSGTGSGQGTGKGGVPDAPTAGSSAAPRNDNKKSVADGKAIRISDQIAVLANKVKTGQAEFVRLQAAQANAKDPGDAAEATELAQTQLALDEDDLEDLQQQLTESGGDPHGEIEQALKSHEQLEEKPPTSPGAMPPLDTLALRYGFWVELRDRRTQVDAAKQNSDALLARLTKERAARAAVVPAGPLSTSQSVPPDRAGTIAQLKHQAIERQTLTEYDRRIDDARQLSSVYAKWSALLGDRIRLQVHYMLQTLAWLLLIAAVAIVLDGVVRRYFDRLPAERSWQRNLRVFLLALIYAVSFVTALVLVFGKPSEFETLLGLVGAGLTVALKDFIVGFLGWFFLAGSNGVRIGDWVEIEGVAGEVVDIGLLRTVLLESGNWTETGHPTGRRVSFLNSYAVQGHYFNYTTHGQWLWDEIVVPLPNDAGMYGVADELDRAMQQESATDAEAAAAEWKHVAERYGVTTFSPRPTVNVRPGSTGPEAVIRYVTQAACRADTRARISASAMRVLRAPQPNNQA